MHPVQAAWTPEPLLHRYYGTDKTAADYLWLLSRHWWTGTQRGQCWDSYFTALLFGTPGCRPAVGLQYDNRPSHEAGHNERTNTSTGGGASDGMCGTLRSSTHYEVGPF